MPTARAMPSSVRRSAASITKIRKISRMPAAIENEPNVVKRDMNAAPCSSAVLSASCLLLSASRPSGASAGGDSRSRDRSRRAPSWFATKHELDQARLAEQPLRRRERHQQALVGRAPAVVADDVLDAHDRRAARPTRMRRESPLAGAEARGGLRVRGRPRPARDLASETVPRCPRIGPNAFSERASPAKSVTRGSFWRRGQVLHRDRLDDHGSHAVDEARGRGRARDARGVALREVAHAGRAGAVGREREPRRRVRQRPRRRGRARRLRTSGSSGSSCRRSPARRR